MRRALAFWVGAYSGLPRAVWIVCAGMLINRAGTMVLPFLGLYLTRELGFPKATAGWVLLGFGLGSLLGSAVGGRLTDRAGAVRVQVGALLAGGVAFVALAWPRTPWTLGAGVFIAAALSDAFRPAAMTAVVVLAPEAVRTRAIGLLRLAANAGMAIGPAAGGLLARIDYFWLFVADGGTCLLASLVLWLLLRPERPVRRTGIEPEARAGAGVLRDGAFVLFLGGLLALSAAFFQVFNTYPIYLAERLALDEARIGSLIAANAVLIVLFEMPLVRLLERRTALRVTAAGAALIGGGLALTAVASSVPLLLATVVVWTIGEMLCFPFASAVIAARAPRGLLGRYMGAFAVVFSLAAIVAPPAGLRLYEARGGASVFLACGAIGALVCGLFLAQARVFAHRPEAGR
ncbi:MAG: MFS transporter [Acidobacteria bacterium]|nr:MAG: MFS transporter [Acidobacteriota bacterium]